MAKAAQPNPASSQVSLDDAYCLEVAEGFFKSKQNVSFQYSYFDRPI